MNQTTNTAYEKLHSLAAACAFPLNPGDLISLYNLLVEKSDLSEEAIMHEIESLVTNIDPGSPTALNLGIDEISFLIAHNLILHFYPGAVRDDIHEIGDTVYDYAFNFILRNATIETMALSRRYRVSMRKAFLAIGIQHASREGRLTDQFGTATDRIRHLFATRAGESI